VLGRSSQRSLGMVPKKRGHIDGPAPAKRAESNGVEDCYPHLTLLGHGGMALVYLALDLSQANVGLRDLP
jgi:hypothetical protein